MPYIRATVRGRDRGLISVGNERLSRSGTVGGTSGSSGHRKEIGGLWRWRNDLTQ